MASAIIVFSHVRWDFVYCRPQQLMARLAAHQPVVFVEEPQYREGEAALETYSPLPGVLVCQPLTPVGQPGFHDDQLPYLRPLLRQALRGLDDHIAWFYTPMALPLLQELQPKLVVYDCMEEAAAFRHAPRQWRQRENALLKAADLVLAGGRDLYRARRRRHPNVHYLPGGVDAAHFETALERANSHPAHREIPGPRLGYYGVLDERLDVALLGQLADAHPRWQIVLVGPVRGIDPQALPQRANVHYLGLQPYHALPHFLAGWDVCLLPFALNGATRASCPLKLLEYMAAELPVVSTPLPEVTRSYRDVVAVAGDAQAFVAACEEALLAPPQAHAARAERMRAALAPMAWDARVDKVRKLLDSAPRRRAQPEAAAGVVPDGMPSINRLPRSEAPRYVATAIIGAGPTGLSAAYHLGHDAVLFEKQPMVGGRCRSVREKGFTFDHAGHVMLSDDPYVLALYRILLGSNLHWQDSEDWVVRKNAGLAPAAAMRGIGRGGAARFAYPLRGGIQALMSGFVPHIKGTIELNAHVVRISPRQRTFVLAGGRRFQYRNLISTMPLPELVRALGDEAPDEIRRAAAGLRYLSQRCVSLGVARERITDKHWIHMPEGAIFHRIFAQGNASPECNPPGGFGLTCEIGYSPQDKPPLSGQALAERCRRDCIDIGLLRRDDCVLAVHEIDMPYAHVVYDRVREKNVQIIKDWLDRHGIVVAGRHAEWEPDSADHAFIAGKKAAETIKWLEPAQSALAE
ncbi:FAD-dependent oxidoreductase [Noviherbaspirillum sp. UKPF54]|uniref:FAD-dependent oxidoreductase n=1 Tax=Noviherbaspirillum sp. UKPF54 TaxID=2601898 RepID=UPI0011B1299E|nr:FAD-dependent oxidoreductase [Noviherbaspirillum sp. UKPF54]QDZ27038.1 glycosyltransferase [Noviherbaspirillum sp. UKPF54]